MLHVSLILLLFYSLLIFSVESKLCFKHYASGENNTNFSVNIGLNKLTLCFNNLSSSITEYRNKINTHDVSFIKSSNLWTICHATFIKRQDYISVINIDNEFLNPKEVYNEFELVEWHTTVKTFSVSNDVIITVRSSEKLNELFYTKSSLWNQKSIFVIIVLECTKSIETEMTTLWLLHRIYKYVLICTKMNPVLYIYRPFVPTVRSKIDKVKHLSEIVDNIDHATDNLYGSEMRIVFFPRKATAVIRNGKYIAGVDYGTLVTLQEQMNFSSVIFTPSDGQTFTHTGKNISGSIRDIVLGNADISLNGHFLQDYKIDEILLTHQVYMDKLCFVVAMPSFMSHYTIITHIFSPLVWGLIVIIYISIIILYYAIQKNDKTQKQKYKIQDLFFLLYELIIFGASNIRADKISKRFLLGSVLITVLILNNSFQGSLVTVLSKPILKPFINTLDQIVESDLALKSERVDSLVSDPELINLLNTLRKRKLTENNFVRVGRFPITKLRFYKNYNRKTKNATESLHRVQECIMSNFLTYVVPKNSPFLDKINMNLLKIQESGLNVKWFSMDDQIRKVYQPIEIEQLTQTEAKTFTMADLAFLFTILLFGLTMSSVIFLAEHYIVIKNKIIKK